MGCCLSKRNAYPVGDYDPSSADYTDAPDGSGLKLCTVDSTIRDARRTERPRVQEGQMWTDPDFPLHVAITDNASKHLLWMRPQEFVSDPVLFSNGTFRLDIQQRNFGTCWFLAMLSTLADKPDLCKQVINERSYTPRTDGICHCRLWRFGEWEDVYIDDHLPVFPDGRTMYGAASATARNEMWVPFMEKALARLHGSYTVVEGGYTSDAYLMLTGGVAEKIDFYNTRSRAAAYNIFSRISNALNTEALVTCSVSSRYHGKMGLMGPHAYSISGTFVVTRRDGVKVPLLRIRNPHGRHEWTGRWCDGSGEWDTLAEGSHIHRNRNEGEFWIDVGDFLRYFKNVTICSLTPDFDKDGRSDSLNYVLRVFSEWRGKSAVGPGTWLRQKLRNPRVAFTVPKTGEDFTPVVVQLIQKAEFLDYAAIRCDMFRVASGDEQSGTIYVDDIPDANPTRLYESSLQWSSRYKLSPGRYIVIPSTYYSGVEREFLIRVYTPCPLYNCGTIPGEVAVKPEDICMC
ncbi:calpain-A-like [Haliotis rubra]|uniref:calpain-A-like n=1 Tax=Haliotis rubra TaxID=36100 RepID=UPI001EE57359|nr:calpain-A-like [Haliotis rubra]XP_046565489.1 calpain-A-like [Haliotis rubra]XP_046565501.1 calpain-A-like [Haliotis rubra]